MFKKSRKVVSEFCYFLSYLFFLSAITYMVCIPPQITLDKGWTLALVMLVAIWLKLY